MNEKNILSSRFIQAFERLLADNKIKDKKDFAAKIGISASLVTEIAKGRSAVGVTALQNIVLTFNINPAWLLTGTGEIFPSAAPLSPADELRPRIPLTAVAGRLPDITSSVTLADCEMLPAVRLLPPYKCTIIIQGDSMEPKFEGGDEIAIREVVDYIEWGKTYVLDTEDGPVLKRLYDDGDSFRCVSYNPDYPPFTIEKQKVYRVFKVVGLIRRCN